MHTPPTYFITWTTYGSWLPGDSRWWKKWKSGEQQPQPQLEAWCRDRMSESPVLLNSKQCDRVQAVCVEHAAIRRWELHAIAVRSNHVHLAVTADAKPAQVRDQFKANSTRVLRQPPDAMRQKKVWTRGGDVQVVDGELDAVIAYIAEAQDRMGRGR